MGKKDEYYSKPTSDSQSLEARQIESVKPQECKRLGQTEVLGKKYPSTDKTNCKNVT